MESNALDNFLAEIESGGNENPFDTDFSTETPSIPATEPKVAVTEQQVIPILRLAGSLLVCEE
ncbi:MAG: hypothetical protein LBC82_02755 [Oscillospiraceae bacterium]|jgi:hypothetical protein|nr:hypothetical protein [Oscillospiraceae bacterium]